ncbi:aminotransferase class V-fold PLP-dependent enzyme [Nonomuraea deserti]|uniref:Aminotransferase class V-fold PLP-dependent enzyme n=1 Tax=Nonomuraea deserti TaxID=1848322 RepID=A0A4R4VYJ5_9ACTN|nr:aminotransferase class V-fold PLP-dependent enzyme [Nonomuraea deserti]TDD11192.1 aminotransferase class V-fold PLP-dependent enzyme [Nonomuraea deserti]
MIGKAWRAARSVVPPGHLDAAGCNVPGDRVFDAVAGHLRLERERGGYAAEPDLTGPKSALATLIGASGSVGAIGEGFAAGPVGAGGEGCAVGAVGAGGASPGDVAFVESGTAAMAALLGGWRLPPGSRVGFARTEYGSTLMLLRRLAAGRSWTLVELPVDADSRLDLDGLDAALATGLDLVTLVHIASHRGVVQPAREAGALCRAAGVPLVLDACQSFGHTDVSGVGATAYVGTSRKWLAGPRGVGFLIVPGLATEMDAAAPALGGHAWAADGSPEPLPGAIRYEGSEGAIASRVGLGVAVREYQELGPADLHEHVAELGRTTRHLLHGAGGWQVAEPLDEPSAIVTLRPPAGDSVEAARARAAAAGLLVGAAPVARAPLDLREPVLRVSPAPGTEAETLHTLARVLSAPYGPTRPPAC